MNVQILKLIIVQWVQPAATFKEAMSVCAHNHGTNWMTTLTAEVRKLMIEQLAEKTTMTNLKDYYT